MPKKTEIVEVKNVEAIAVVQVKELSWLKSAFNNCMAESKSLKIIDEKSKTDAISLIRDLDDLGKKYKKLREKLYKPIKDHIKAMEGEITPYEKAIKDAIGDWKSGLRGQLSQYETQQAEIRRKEEEKLQADQQKKYEKEIKKAEKKGLVPPPAPSPVTVEAPKSEDTSLMDKAVYEVEDFSKVDRCWLTINDKLVTASINKGLKVIPGLKIWTIKVPRIKKEVEI